jgi:polyphosphate kinase
VSKAALASIGDRSVLNVPLSRNLAEVWIDRDLSWLDFNDRVLWEALDERTPLLERVKFLAIFTSNLDEFFMKRMAIIEYPHDGGHRELAGQLREKLIPMLKRQADCYRFTIVPELAKHGILLRTWSELTAAQKEEANAYFDNSVSPALTPLVIDPVHPFPFLSNLSTSLTFILREEDTSAPTYARVKVPGVLKQWVHLTVGVTPHEMLLVPLHEVICGNAHLLYRGVHLTGATLFRLTRDAEVETEELDNSSTELSEVVREQVRLRRYEPVVRLEFGPDAPSAIKEMLRERFRLSAEDVYDMPAQVDYTALLEIAGLPHPELHDQPWTPLLLQRFGGTAAGMFSAIRAGDILVHHPYESFDDSVERFIAAAADDPETVSIKMTAYRVGDDTPFVKSLIRAAEMGKQVACVIEIKARFDEERNLHWAAELERVGAHVTFGVRGLKTHAKTALVVRKEGNALRCYAHIGTGNYHVKTARLYADFGLLTCNPALTRDVVNLFHYLTGHSDAPDCATLLVAPGTMRVRLLELIRREMDNRRLDKPARIVAKMNQLEDPEMIESLCEASIAGVPIDLIVRGFCCLRPGIPGHTENIRVRSIIGRFLEHSRIFHFANGKVDPIDGDFFIGSADWMFRNLSKRIEVVTPIYAEDAKTKLWECLEICMRDRRQAWELGSDGNWTQLRPVGITANDSLGTHDLLMRHARQAHSAHAG